MRKTNKSERKVAVLGTFHGEPLGNPPNPRTDPMETERKKMNIPIMEARCQYSELYDVLIVTKQIVFTERSNWGPYVFSGVNMAPTTGPCTPYEEKVSPKTKAAYSTFAVNQTHLTVP